MPATPQATTGGGYELTEPSDGIPALASVLERRPNKDVCLSPIRDDYEVDLILGSHRKDL